LGQKLVSINLRREAPELRVSVRLVGHKKLYTQKAPCSHRWKVVADLYLQQLQACIKRCPKKTKWFLPFLFIFRNRNKKVSVLQEQRDGDTARALGVPLLILPKFS